MKKQEFPDEDTILYILSLTKFFLLIPLLNSATVGTYTKSFVERRNNNFAPFSLICGAGDNPSFWRWITMFNGMVLYLRTYFILSSTLL
ncbi:MAG: hypothetical protein ACRC0A_03690 [Chitinophagaceae bacterium]